MLYCQTGNFKWMILYMFDINNLNASECTQNCKEGALHTSDTLCNDFMVISDHCNDAMPFVVTAYPAL